MLSISTGQRPGLLDDLGLLAAMEWQAEEFQNRTGIRCTFTLDDEDITVDDRRSPALFRILQETLSRRSQQNSYSCQTKVTPFFPVVPNIQYLTPVLASPD